MSVDSLTDEQLRILSDSDTRAVLTALEAAGGEIHVEELAERLVSRDTAIVGTAEYEADLEETVISLHHGRLPKLAEIGLVEYDPDEHVVAPRTSAAATLDWQATTAFDDVVADLLADPGERGEVATIEGREPIVEYGRRLADEADEELFCMYVTPDLLAEECVRRARNAIERGVEMYMGSRNADVRELTRERLPEATVWEPQFDLHKTASYPRVGRLVVVDRRKVMLAVLEEAADDAGSEPAETAVAADGADHPLVVLVRELLGPRLDHLDYQSGDFRSELVS